MLRHIPAYSGTRRTYQTFSLNMWGDGRDRYRRITRYCLTISIYLFVSVVYTSAVKARYNYRFEITSPNSARYFTRWFESRRLHRCRGIPIRYYVRLPADNSDRRLPTCPATRDRTEQKCNDQDLVNGLLIARPVVLRSLR